MWGDPWRFKSSRPHHFRQSENNTKHKTKNKKISSMSLVLSFLRIIMSKGMSKIDRQPDGTIKITITLPLAEVEKTSEAVVGEMVKHVTVPGFREGKAPLDTAKGRLNPEHVREEVLKKLLPPAYMEAIQEHNIKPIMNPKMHVEEVAPDKDWVFAALTCEMPEVELGAYKKEVQKITAKSKIILPRSASSGPAAGKEEESKKPALDDVVKAVLETAKVTVPAVLVEQETDRLLSQLLNDIKRLGLSLEQYLGTTKRTPEDLRNEYAQRATEDIKLEFVLQKIAETEKITVDNKEVEEAIQKAQDPKERESMEANKYMLAGILRQQKTLDFLMNL
jgi:FKBP-type peptidyl-prolyl cis-trans isomerase (trigger factor)